MARSNRQPSRTNLPYLTKNPQNHRSDRQNSTLDYLPDVYRLPRDSHQLLVDHLFLEDQTAVYEIQLAIKNHTSSWPV